MAEMTSVHTAAYSPSVYIPTKSSINCCCHVTSFAMSVSPSVCLSIETERALATRLAPTYDFIIAGCIHHSDTVTRRQTDYRQTSTSFLRDICQCNRYAV